MSVTRLATTAGLVLVAAVACSSDDDAADGADRDEQSEHEEAEATSPLDGDGRDAYVAGFGETVRDPVSGELTDRASCIAEAVVDGVGVEQLRDVASPREIAAAASGDGGALESLGVEVDAAQADAIYDGIQGCGEPAEMFFESIPGAQPTGPVAECFKEQLSEDLLQEILMTRLVEGDQAFADKPEIAAELSSIGSACAFGGT
jgi:hypothetical protein